MKEYFEISTYQFVSERQLTSLIANAMLPEERRKQWIVVRDCDEKWQPVTEILAREEVEEIPISWIQQPEIIRCAGKHGSASPDTFPVSYLGHFQPAQDRSPSVVTWPLQLLATPSASPPSLSLLRSPALILWVSVLVFVVLEAALGKN